MDRSESNTKGLLGGCVFTLADRGLLWTCRCLHPEGSQDGEASTQTEDQKSKCELWFARYTMDVCCLDPVIILCLGVHVAVCDLCR